MVTKGSILIWVLGQSLRAALSSIEMIANIDCIAVHTIYRETGSIDRQIFRTSNNRSG